MKRTEVGVFNIHRDLVVLFRVCRAENFALLSDVDVEEPALELPGDAPEHV